MTFVFVRKVSLVQAMIWTRQRRPSLVDTAVCEMRAVHVSQTYAVWLYSGLSFGPGSISVRLGKLENLQKSVIHKSLI